MEDRALVASIDLTGMTWPDGLTTIGKIALQNSLAPMSQPGFNLPKFHPIQGRVTLDGKPLVGARVAFHRTDKEASRVFAATSNAEGYYEILAPYSPRIYQGAPVGHYKVTVIKVADPELTEKEFDEKYLRAVEAVREGAEPVSLDDPAYLVDKRYTSGQTTPFEVEVEEGRNSFDFNLTSKPAPNN